MAESMPYDGYVRDLVGYGGKPPCVAWPNGAYLAINVVLNYEEGGESCVLNGDAQSEQFLSEVVGIAPVHHDRCPQVESMYEYGARAGFWRLRRLLCAHGVPVTVFAVASALQRNPAVVAALREAASAAVPPAARWEVATHGYRWLDYRAAAYADERRDTLHAVRVQTELLGTAPVGCYIGRTSAHSARICAELGFLYDADSYADDCPYYTQPRLASDGDARYMLVVPYTLDVNDMKFLGNNGFTESEQFFRYLRDQFDVLYDESVRSDARAPLVMSIGLHCRIAGRPARARGLQRFLQYVAEKDALVWFATRRDIAEHWLRQVPPPGPTFYDTTIAQATRTTRAAAVATAAKSPDAARRVEGDANKNDNDDEQAENDDDRDVNA